MVRDLLAFLHNRINALRLRDPEGVLPTTEALAARIGQHLEDKCITVSRRYWRLSNSSVFIADRFPGSVLEQAFKTRLGRRQRAGPVVAWERLSVPVGCAAHGRRPTQ